MASRLRESHTSDSLSRISSSSSLSSSNNVHQAEDVAVLSQCNNSTSTNANSASELAPFSSIHTSSKHATNTGQDSPSLQVVQEVFGHTGLFATTVEGAGTRPTNTTMRAVIQERFDYSETEESDTEDTEDGDGFDLANGLGDLMEESDLESDTPATDNSDDEMHDDAEYEESEGVSDYTASSEDGEAEFYEGSDNDCDQGLVSPELSDEEFDFSSSTCTTPEEFVETEQKKCAICLDILVKEDLVQLAPCGHLLCWTCFREWARHLKRSKRQAMPPSCPICRRVATGSIYNSSTLRVNK